jgi:hypothetical protein
VGLLDDLKQQADALRAQDVDRTESLRSNAVAVDHALRRAFLYMNDLGKQLNVVKMPSPFVYKLPTVGDIADLVFKDFFADFRTRNFIDKDYYGEVHLATRCWSDKVLTIKKGPDDMEKFRDILWQYNIEHKSEQYRDQRKVITHEIFEVKCDFRVQAKFEGDHESGKLKIMVKNIGDFTIDVFQMLASEFNDKAVEEFAKYFIGRPNDWLEIVKRSVLNQRAASLAAPKPRLETQYVVPKVAPSAPAPEEKRGLLGSLRSFIRKDG